MSSITGPSRLHKQQSGMVSILVTMLMMIIISLIVLGFAQVSRREQRQALDNQLSTQAYYAAESGINDARSAILGILGSGGTVPDKTSCGNDTNYSLNSVINATSKVSYPCLLIDATPQALNYTVSGNSTIIPLVNSGGGGFGASGVTLTWKKPTADSATSYTNCYQNVNLGKFPPAAGAGAWACPYGVMQADLVAAPLGAPITRAGLTAGTKAIFFDPIQTATVPAGGNNFSMSTGGAGTVIAAKCDDTSCKANITNMTANRYFLRINSVYKNNFNLTITNGAGANFSDAQAVVDATGKAQDVLRRIRVAIDTTDANTSARAGAAIITQDSICKRFGVAKGFFSNGSATDYPGGADNQLCQAGTSGALASACLAPHDIVLVLDASSSMGTDWEGITRREELRKVAEVFVDSTGVSSQGNHVGVVSFSSAPYSYQDIGFSYDSTAVKNAIETYPSHSGTNYMAGLQLASTLFSSARSGVPKVMIFISDGQPDQGGGQAQIVPYTNNMKSNGILVYTIGIVDGDEGTNILSNMSNTPQSTYYTTAATHFNFEDFFGGISSQVTC